MVVTAALCGESFIFSYSRPFKIDQLIRNLAHLAVKTGDTADGFERTRRVGPREAALERCCHGMDDSAVLLLVRENELHDKTRGRARWRRREGWRDFERH